MGVARRRRQAAHGQGGGGRSGHQPQHGDEGLLGARARGPGRGPPGVGTFVVRLPVGPAAGHPARGSPAASRSGCRRPGTRVSTTSRSSRCCARRCRNDSGAGGGVMHAVTDRSTTSVAHPAAWASATAPRGRCRTAPSRVRPAGSPRWSGPTAPARPRCCACWSGSARPTAGEASVLGRPPGQDEEFLASIGYLAQDVPLYRRLSAEDHIASRRPSQPALGRRRRPRRGCDA